MNGSHQQKRRQTTYVVRPSPLGGPGGKSLPVHGKRHTTKHKRINTMRLAQRRVSVRMDPHYMERLGVTHRNKHKVDPKLLKQLEQLRSQVFKERVESETIRTQTKESLALLSETMFKKLLVQENDFQHELKGLDSECEALESKQQELQDNRVKLVQTSHAVIDQLRSDIKCLSERLQKYEPFK